MFILTSQDGLSTGILGANSVVQALPTSPNPDTEYALLVNGLSFGSFKTQAPALSALEEVKTRLALILSQGASSGVEPQYTVPADID